MTWPSRTLLTRAAMALAMAVGAAGCSIQPNSAPRDVPEAQRPQLETEPDAGQAIGAGRVFLLAGSSAETRLRSVPREAEPGAPIIQSLLDGPNEGELDDGLQTALPSGLELRSVRSSGTTMTIDLSDEVLNLNSAQLRVAIAQLVFTASEIDGVGGVRILVDGTPRTWPDGRGTLRSSTLSVFDFPDLAETSQPRLPPIPSPRPS